MGDRPEVYVATVDSVDIGNRTCSCSLVSGSTDIALTNVKLMANVDDGMLITPTVGSTVIIESAPNIEPYVSMFSGIDKVFQVAGGSTYQIDSDGIKLNGENFDGLVKVAKLTEKLNNIEDLLNDLITKYNAHTHPYVNVAAPATTSPTTSLETGTIAPITSQSDIENTTVKHGDGS